MVKVTLFALVMAADWFTVSVKLCVPSVPMPLWAVKVMGYAPDVPLAGVPLRIPVLELNVTPDGSAPVSDKIGAGSPVAVTVNDPTEPTANEALFALVTAAGWFTVSVKLWEASVPMPLCAVNVIG
jgi:hypothetical protein